MVVDGFISTAGALIAYSLEPFVRDYIICRIAAWSRGIAICMRRFGLKPLLDLNLRLGEGTGAALAMNLVDAAVQGPDGGCDLRRSGGFTESHLQHEMAEEVFRSLSISHNFPPAVLW